MENTRIPLFPLEVVLFPGALLPLHIFEPRYKLLVRHCRESQEPFGVILSQGEAIAQVGCTAEILEVSKEYPDGKLDILTIGRRPYRVVEVHQERAYWEASVEYLEEEPFVEPSPNASLMELYDRCHHLVFGQPPDAPAESNFELLTFQIASELPLDLAYKQNLLEMRNEGDRQQSLEGALHKWLMDFEQVSRARRIAGGNGHAKVN
jgi:Lon protease-like protein